MTLIAVGVLVVLAIASILLLDTARTQENAQNHSTATTAGAPRAEPPPSLLFIVSASLPSLQPADQQNAVL